MGGTPSTPSDKDDLDTGLILKEERISKTPLMEKRKPIDAKLDRFRVKQNVEESYKNRNYGVIPLNVVHQIMLFLEPSDLFSMMLTCKMFEEVCNSNFFWKSYYCAYFECSSGTNNEKKCVSQRNWKKSFFVELCGGDYFYRKKYERIGRRLFQDLEFHTIVLVGDDGAGKTSFVRRVVENRFENEDQSIEVAKGAQKKLGGVWYELAMQYNVATDEGKVKFILRIIDTKSGQGGYMSKINFANYRIADGVIVFHDIQSYSDEDKLRSTQGWIKYARRHCIHNMTQFLVAGSKLDLAPVNDRILRGSNKYYAENVKSLSDDLGVKYVEISSKNDENVYKALGGMIDSIIYEKLS